MISMTRNIFGYAVVYVIKTNATINKNYAYIININLNPEGFGLIAPLKEGKSHSNTMNRFQQYLRECVRETLMENELRAYIDKTVRGSAERLSIFVVCLTFEALYYGDFSI